MIKSKKLTREEFALLLAVGNTCAVFEPQSSPPNIVPG